MSIPVGNNYSITPFPFIMEPLTQVTPFSYRDGMTYAKMVEGLRHYLNTFIVPEFNGKMDEIISDFQEGILNAENTITQTKIEWQTEMAEKLAISQAAFNAALAESQANFDAKQLEWLTQFDLFMDNVIAEIKTLNDTAFAELLSDQNSLTAKAIPVNNVKLTKPNIEAYAGNAPTVWDNLGYKLTLNAMRENMATKLKKTIYMPWVVKIPVGTPNRLGAYYLYWSTDHDNNTGGIFMAYADHPEGPWTPYNAPLGWVFNDGGAGRGNQTEIPCVVWFKGTAYLYYQNKGSSLSPALQAVFVATSVDGLTWTKTDNGIYPTNSDLPGNMQPGYHNVVNMGERLVSFLNISGGEYSRQGVAHSMDALTWTLDKELIVGRVNISGSNLYRNIWLPRLYEWKNELWASTNIKSLSAGLDDASYNKAYMVKVREDLRGFKGTMKETNFAGSSYIEHNGDLYGFASYYNKADLNDNNGGVSVWKLASKW